MNERCCRKLGRGQIIQSLVGNNRELGFYHNLICLTRRLLSYWEKNGQESRVGQSRSWAFKEATKALVPARDGGFHSDTDRSDVYSAGVCLSGI